MGKHHHSRREILSRISVLGSGTLLTSAVNPGWGQTSPRGALRARIRDGATNQPTSAKVRIVHSSTGAEFWPESCIKTMPRKPKPGGRRYFYAVGEFEAALPPGDYQVEIVRGIAHDAVRRQVRVAAGATLDLELSIPVLRDMHAAGWYSGNTHTHYQLEMDEDPDDHLRVVPPAEALDLSVLSYLIRQDLKYISNKYPIGRLPEFSKNGTLIDMGEEARNNKGPYDFGYGHVLFLNIPRLVEPVSTGLLSPIPNAPDFPTISMLCDDAKSLGGTTIWCHNGQGMELPVAAALGSVDAFNVGDAEPGEYSRYYQFLNCGFRMPIATGTDWYIYDHNRVFVQTGGAFTYESWLAGLRAGRSFITSGPLLQFEVNRQGPGGEVTGPARLKIRAGATSRLPFDRLEIVHDGEVVASAPSSSGRDASIETELPFETPGWIAARVSSDFVTHGGYRIFAHTNPVWLKGAGRPARQRDAARAFVNELTESIAYIAKLYRFRSQADSAIALGRFEKGLRYYQQLAAG